MMRIGLAVAVAVVVVGAVVFGCAPPVLVFYETTRTRSAECLIRSNGEFCAEPEEFAAPVIEVWTLEVTDRVSRVFVDEEVWVIDPLPEGEPPFAAFRTAARSISVASGVEPCTTTTTQNLGFTADDKSLSGELKTETRLEGPAACGNTPVGERTTDELAGVAGAP